MRELSVDYVEFINRLFTVPSDGELTSVLDALITSVEAATMQGYVSDSTSVVTLKRLEDIYKLVKASER